MGRKKTTEEFIIDAKKVHGDKYKYPDEYNGSKNKIRIICPIHGEFRQKPNNHLNGNGCVECSGSKKLSFSDIVNNSIVIHDNKYIYTEQPFKNNKSIINIICPIHGIFTQEINSHLSGHGCKKCHDDSKISNELLFTNKANEIHNNKYDYSKFKYVDSKHKGIIICSKHGEFEQKPNDHLSGRGCPKCNSSKGEKHIMVYLDDNDVIYEEQKTFKECNHKNPLKFDFYLPDYNLCIEYDGEQHFKPIDAWGGEDRLKIQKLRDNIKNEYCKENNINILRIRYDENIVEKLLPILGK